MGADESSEGNGSGDEHEKGRLLRLAEERCCGEEARLRPCGDAESGVGERGNSAATILIPFPPHTWPLIRFAPSNPLLG